ncbi:MAG: penicillin acylase family protein, partial [Chitinophagaceae bacterium]|nr:penicillin acylase family protein [Rubrivivax sp.]
RAQAATALLAGWDLQTRGDSAAAALFEVWWSRHLGAAFRDALLPRNAATLIRTTHEDMLLDTLEKPDERFGNNARARRDSVLEKSLAAAWADMQTLAGNDPARWQWGRLHHSLFAHPLAKAAQPHLQPQLSVGPMPKQGGSDTVNVSAFDPATLRQVGGPSFRIVLDVGGWDNSRAINAPGQSGDPSSPHYRDLAPLWLKGDYFPLLYSRARIESVAAQRIELLPTGAGPRARTPATGVTTGVTTNAAPGATAASAGK